MKKFIFSLAVFGMFVSFGSVTHADVRCGDPANSNSMTQFTVCSNGNPENVVNAWGTTNSQLPHIKRGETRVLLNGTTATCPIWFPMDCVDISGTAYYQARWGR